MSLTKAFRQAVEPSAQDVAPQAETTVANDIDPDDIIMREAEADLHQKNETLHFNLNQAGLADKVGIVATNALPADVKTDEKKKREKERSFSDWLNLIKSAKASLAEMGQSINRTLSKAEQYLQDLKDTLAERKAMENAKALLEGGDVLEREENGKLKDRNLQKAVERWQKKSGVEDVSDDALVLAIIDKEMPLMPSESELTASIQTQEILVKSLKGCETERQGLVQDGEGIEHKSDEEKQQFLDKTQGLDKKVQGISNELNHIYDMKAKGAISDTDVEKQTRAVMEKYDDKTVLQYQRETGNQVSTTEEARKDKVDIGAVASSKVSDMFADEEPEHISAQVVVKPAGFAPG